MLNFWQQAGQAVNGAAVDCRLLQLDLALEKLSKRHVLQQTVAVRDKLTRSKTYKGRVVKNSQKSFDAGW